MLVTCAESAEVDGSVCVFLEPIALYHTRICTTGDEGWVAALTDEHVPIGSARTYLDGGDLTIVTWANGLHLSLRVARTLAVHGIRARVLDLRWLAPLPVADLLREGNATGRRLVVDETRRTGGVSEGVIAELVDAGFARPRRPRDEQGFLRPPRRRRPPRSRLRGGDRGGGGVSARLDVPAAAQAGGPADSAASG